MNHPAPTARRGDWMETRSGRKLWPLDIRPGDVTAFDVGHALAMTCRYGGHTLKFYSVAEHCCLLADYAIDHLGDRGLALDLLVHDAAEAFLGDIPRPLKKSLPTEWKAIEHAADRACVEALGGRFPFSPEVKELDNRILVDERTAVMSLSDNAWDTIERVAPLGVEIQCWDPERARQEWLCRHEALTAEVK